MAFTADIVNNITSWKKLTLCSVQIKYISVV